MARRRFKSRAETLAFLASIPKKVKAAVRPAIEAEAAAIVAMQKRLVATATGRLKRSIRFEMGDVDAGSSGVLVAGGRAGKARRGRSKGSAGGTVAGDPDLSATIVAGDGDAYYARFVEFGTKAHRVGGKYATTTHGGTTAREPSEHPGTAPRPFFYGPFRARRKTAKRRVSRAIRKAVQEA